MFINPNGYYESFSGLILPKSTRKPRAFDFFAGCGAFSLGFIQAGYEVVGMNEIAFDPILSYCVNLSKQPLSIHTDTSERKSEFNAYLEKAMFPKEQKHKYFKQCHVFHESQVLDFASLPGTGWILSQELAGNIYPPVRNIFIADIKNLTGEYILGKLGMERGELDCVMGGPPCQGYSRIGKQDINDPRNELIFEYARIIVELNPRTFVMEEVPDIVKFRTPRGTFVLEEFGMILDEGGYMEFSQFCEAQKFVPQSKRFRKIKPVRNMSENERQIYKKQKDEKQLTLF
ncbi:MAG: DNA cytosine methyltransferase [Bacteroidales bacterium]|jgi:DNA (cytosine-5)-methyltransferase 1|nr:DNA cytosine methyltransferase [Bacteroidales bacterium]